METEIKHHFYKNGVLKRETEVLNGLEHGTQKAYSENGIMTWQAQLKNGVYHGIYQDYLEDGRRTLIQQDIKGTINVLGIEFNYEN